MQRLKNNQNWLDKIRSTQIAKHLAFFGLGALSWLGFSYLIILYLKIMQGGSIYKFPWHWDAPLWTFLYSLFGAAVIIFTKWKLDLFSEKSKSLWRDFFTLVFLIPVNAFIVTAFPIIVLGHSFTGRQNITSYEWVIGFLHAIFPQIFVVFTCTGYFYLNLVSKTKERLSAAQQAKMAMEMKMLQQNIEPHFLFNNLNALSSLIESNPQKANEFLEKLSELYRYILQTQKLETVSLKDELDFARNYVYLLQTRFGNAYRFDWKIDESKLNGQKVMPVSVQSLIENAIKHNTGSKAEPLSIRIVLGADFLRVENEKSIKRQTYPTTQAGLKNLQIRNALLTERAIKIVEDEKHFAVELPLLH